MSFSTVFILFLLSNYCQCYNPGTVNVGSVLFSTEDLQKTNWSNYELALLKTRMIFQKLVPPNSLLLQYSVEATCTHLLNYFKASYAIVKKEAPHPDIENILALSLSDVIGGYMKALVLPMAKLAYYSGSLSYRTTFNMYDYYDKLRKCVITNGDGWQSPQEKVLVIVTRNIQKRHAYRRNIHNTCSLITFSADEEESVPTLPLPKIEKHANSSFVILPLRAGTRYSLNDPKTANAIFKYYDAVLDCLESDPIDLAEFYANFQEWLHSDIVCHISDENIYQGFAGVLKLFNEPNLHRIFTRQCDKSNSKTSKKFFFLMTVGVIEITWALCALLLVYIKKNGLFKENDDEIVIYSRSGGKTGNQSFKTHSSARQLHSEFSKDSELPTPKRFSTEMQTDQIGYEMDCHSASCSADLLQPMVEKTISGNQFPSKSELDIETFSDLTNLPRDDISTEQSFCNYTPTQIVRQDKISMPKSSKKSCSKIIDTSKPSECGMFVKPDEIMLTVLRQASSCKMYPTECSLIKFKDSVEVKREKSKKRKKERVKFNEVVQLSSSDSSCSISGKGSLGFEGKYKMKKSLIKPTKRVFIKETPEFCEKSCVKNRNKNIAPVAQVCNKDLCELRKKLEGYCEVVGCEQTKNSVDDYAEVNACIEAESFCIKDAKAPQQCYANCNDDEPDSEENCEGFCLQSCQGICTCPREYLGSPISKRSIEVITPDCSSNRSISIEIFDTTTNQTALKIAPTDPCLEIKLDTPRSVIKVGTDGNPKISPKRCSRIPVRCGEMPHTSTPKPQYCDTEKKVQKSRIPKIALAIDKAGRTQSRRSCIRKSCKPKCQNFNDTL